MRIHVVFFINEPQLGYSMVQNIAENFNPLSRVNQRYRRQIDIQTTARQTDDRDRRTDRRQTE